MMRLLKKSLRNVYTFAKETVDSGYVGTKETYVYRKTVKCNVQPAENKITSEIYGERVYSMYRLIYGNNCTLCDAVSFTGRKEPTHKIITVEKYSDHIVALAEVIV